jgi:LPS O-antigen subunit length determinant protein (WzzB/FepE family)
MSEQSYNPIPEDEISLKDIIDFLVESWKAIVFTGLLGTAGAVAYLLVTPNQYQVTANFQVAKVVGSDVESPALLLEKLKIPTFYSQKTLSVCNVTEKIDPGAIIAKNLKPTLTKTAPIINITYKAKSIEDARRCLEAVLDDIRTSQNLLSKPILTIKAIQLLTLKQKLESSEKFINKLPNSNFDFSDSKFSSSSLLLATTIMKENEVKDLRVQINEMEISLVDPQTKEAFLTAPIHAPQQKVSPKRAITLIGGLMGGLLLGLLFMLGQKVWGSYKTANL